MSQSLETNLNQANIDINTYEVSREVKIIVHTNQTNLITLCNFFSYYLDSSR